MNLQPVGEYCLVFPEYKSKDAISEAGIIYTEENAFQKATLIAIGHDAQQYFLSHQVHLPEKAQVLIQKDTGTPIHVPEYGLCKIIKLSQIIAVLHD